MQDLLKRVLLGGGGGFAPSALFAAGEAGAWYDPSDTRTMFQDVAGTTPVTAVEQPVGLMLDKSQGLVLGGELVTNGDFSSGTTGWSTSTGFASTATVVSGEFQVTASVASGRQISAITCVIGQTYVVTGVCRQISGTGSAFIGISDATTGASIYTATSNNTSTFVATRAQFVATATTMYVVAGSTGGQGVTAFDNVSVQSIAGNHAISYNNTTARPILRARVNLLTYSEQFDNAAWTKTNTTVTQDAVANPVTGTVNADALFETVTTGAHTATQTVTTAAARYKYSVYIKANGRTRVAIAGTSLLGGNLGNGIFFDLATGSYISGAAGGATPAISSAGNDWWLVSYEWTANANSGVLGIYLVDSGTNTSYAGDITKGVYLWGADLRPANIGSAVPTYQRIAAATDYDSVGFPYYLAFDGVDDGMSTPANLNLTSTDKVTVFAGVRKLSDVVDGIIGELGSSFLSVNGWFLVNVASPAGYAYSGRGNRAGIANDAATASVAGPNTSVLTAQQDINNNTPSTIRRNGALAGSSVNTTFGGGNFGTYPLYLGARTNNSIWFNGQLYSLIVRGAASTASQIVSTEQWVAQKTGISIP